MLTFWKKKLSDRSLSSLNSLNSTLNFLNSLLQKLVKTITAASHWDGDILFHFLSSLRSNLKCFWRLFCSQETKTTWFRTAQYLKNSHVKGLLSKNFFNVLTTKHFASFLNFFVSSMVIMSHLLSLLNKKWTPKPSSTLFMGNRFPFSSKLILASCLAVLHFSNTSGFKINCRFLVIDFRSTHMNGTIGFSHWYFFKYGSTMEHIKLKKIILAFQKNKNSSSRPLKARNSKEAWCSHYTR